MRVNLNPACAWIFSAAERRATQLARGMDAAFVPSGRFRSTVSDGESAHCSRFQPRAFALGFVAQPLRALAANKAIAATAVARISLPQRSYRSCRREPGLPDS